MKDQKRDKDLNQAGSGVGAERLGLAVQFCSFLLLAL